jgi:hypothetical protein
VRRISIEALVPDEGYREPTEWDRRLERREGQVPREQAGDLRGHGDHEVGLRDHERGDQELGRLERDASGQAALSERVVDHATACSPGRDEGVPRRGEALQVCALARERVTAPDETNEVIVEQHLLAEGRQPVASAQREEGKVELPRSDPLGEMVT